MKKKIYICKKRESIRLATIPARIELEGSIVDLDNLKEEDRIDLIEKIIDEENFESEEDVYDNLTSINVDGYFQELNPSEYNNILENHAELLWESYYRDNLVDEIYDNVRREMEYQSE